MNWFFEETTEKNRRVKKELIWFLIIFLVSTASFGLGYFAGQKFNHAPIIIEKSSDNLNGAGE